MDGLIIILFAIYFSSSRHTVIESTEQIVFEQDSAETSTILSRETKLNDNFYYDEDVFMEVAHALGFK